MICLVCGEDVPRAWAHMEKAHGIQKPEGATTPRIKRPEFHREVKVSKKIVRGDRANFSPSSDGCQHNSSRVYDSRKMQDGAVWRRRKCLGCEERYTTLEVIVK